MLKKKLNELTYEDMKNIISNNNELAEELEDRVILGKEEEINALLNDYYGDCGADYYIAPWTQSYFNIHNLNNFEDWFVKVQNGYSLLNEDEEEIVNKFIDYARIKEHLEDIDCEEEDFNNIDNLEYEYRYQTEFMIAETLKRWMEYEDDDIIFEFENVMDSVYFKLKYDYQIV